MKDAKEEPWPTMRMTPDIPEKAKQSSKGASALSGYPSVDEYEALLGLFIFADLFDYGQDVLCWSGKVWCAVVMPASERKHLLRKEKKKSFPKKYIISC